MSEKDAEVARPLPRGAGYAAIDLAKALIAGDQTDSAQDVMRRALDEIAGLPHDEECKTRTDRQEEQPSCDCHVGVAKRALMAAEHVAKEKSAEKPVEHALNPSTESHRDAAETTDTLSTIRVEIEKSNGTIHTWTGETAEKWVKAMNFALLMVQNHGMNPNIPPPTETRKGEAVR